MKIAFLNRPHSEPKIYNHRQIDYAFSINIRFGGDYMEAKNKRRIWMVFVGVCIFQFFGSGLIVNSYGILMKPISVSQGITITQMSIAYSTRILFGAFATQFTGYLLKKLDSRLYFTIVSIGLGICGLLFSAADVFPQFVILAAFLGIFLGLGVYITMPMICNEWFEEPSRYIGIASAGSGLGGIIFSPVLATIIEKLGWRSGYQFVGLCCFLVMLPCGLFLIRFSPKNLGMKPLPAKRVKSGCVAQPASPEGRTLKEAVKTPVFYTLALFIACCPLISIGLTNHFVTIMTVKGFSTTSAALLFSVLSVGNVVVPLLNGALISKLGPRKTLSCFLGLGFIGILGIALIQSGRLMAFAPFAFLIPFCNMQPVGAPLLVREAFGSKHYSDIYPRLQVISYLTGSVVVSLFGSMYDRFGSYDTVFIVICLSVFVVLALINISITLSNRQKAKNDAYKSSASIPK